MTAGQTDQPTKARARLWWQMAIFVPVAVAAVMIGAAFNDVIEEHMPENRTFPSTLNRRASGYSGVFEIAQRAGMTASRWREPYRKLKEHKGTLVMIQPIESLKPFEVDQILDWVKEGNTLVYFDHFVFSFERRLMSRLGMDFETAVSVMDTTVPVESSAPVLSHVDEVTASAEMRIKGGEPLISDKSGAYVSQKQHGKGNVVIGVSPSLCANRRLAVKEAWPNFQLMVNLLRTAGGEVLFDEFCHGYTTSASVFAFLARGPVGLVCLQIAIIFVVALLSHWQRFGAAESLPSLRKISSLEFINGMANTYSRARAGGLAWQIIGHNFRARLARGLGTSTHESDETLVESWKDSGGEHPERLAQFLKRSSEALQQPAISESELVALVESCDKISEHSKELFATARGKTG